MQTNKITKIRLLPIYRCTFSRPDPTLLFLRRHTVRLLPRPRPRSSQVCSPVPPQLVHRIRSLSRTFAGTCPTHLPLHPHRHTIQPRSRSKSHFKCRCMRSIINLHSPIPHCRRRLRRSPGRGTTRGRSCRLPGGSQARGIASIR